jgi:ParB-like chromosome segregation protein Spo0J
VDLFDFVETDDIQTHLDAIKALIAQLPEDRKISALNTIKRQLHEISPFKNEPVDCVLWVKSETVQANDYNPNKVAPPEMRLLEQSIRADGYTQPIVAYPDQRDDREFTVIDGFHRNRVGKECKAVRDRIKGYLPVVSIRESQGDIKDRMASTIRHNRARGVHGVLPMVDIVANLIMQGWNDDEVAKELGMDAEEVLRFKQNSGLPELFKNHEYSKAWE